MTESKASITQEITPSPWVALGMLLIAAFAGLLYGPLALILGLFGVYLAKIEQNPMRIERFWRSSRLL